MLKSNSINNINGNLLIDKFGRNIDYLRLSVTDLCNLRCTYCMPKGIIDKSERHDILTWEEIYRIINIFADLGIKKLRLTGGEPFVRKGLMDFLPKICSIGKLDGVYITTNGTRLKDFIPDLINSCISGINISIDALDPEIYKKITGQDSFYDVYSAIIELIKYNIPIKINVVVSEEIKSAQIISMAYFAKEHPIDIRFIEIMPFNGIDEVISSFMTENMILEILLSEFGDKIQFINHKSNTKLYQIEGFLGRIGIIPGHSRTFCSTCNRIRVTAKGAVKNCLYGGEILDLKSLIRIGFTDEDIKIKIIDSVKQKFSDGFEAFAKKNNSFLVSMSSIGG